VHSDFGRARLAPCPSILSCVICFAAARLTASPKMQITISPTVPRAQRHKWQAEGWRAQRAGPRVWAAYGLKPSPDPTGIVSEDDLLCHVCAVTALRSPQNSPGAATALLTFSTGWQPKSVRTFHSQTSRIGHQPVHKPLPCWQQGVGMMKRGVNAM